MQPPLFLWEPNDLIAFQSVEAMQAFIEPPDVDAGQAFDAAGRLLTVTASGQRTLVTDAEAAPTHQDQLRAALVEALIQAGEEARVSSAPLPELVSIAAARFAAPSAPSLARFVTRTFGRRRA